MMRKASKSERTNSGQVAPQASNTNAAKFRGNSDGYRQFRQIKRNIACNQRSLSLNTFPLRMKPHFRKSNSSSQVEAIHLDPKNNNEISESNSSESNVSTVHIKMPEYSNCNSELNLVDCDGKLKSVDILYIPCEDLVTNQWKQQHRQTAEQLSALEHERTNQAQNELLWVRKKKIFCKRSVRVENVEVKNLLDQNRQVYRSPLTSRMSEYIPYVNHKGESSNQIGFQLTESHSSMMNNDVCDVELERNSDSCLLTRDFQTYKLENQIHNLSIDEDDLTNQISNLPLKLTESKKEMTKTNNNDADDDMSLTGNFQLSEQTSSSTRLELKRAHRNGQNQHLYYKDENISKHLYPGISRPGPSYTEEELRKDPLGLDNYAMLHSPDYSYTLSSKSFSNYEREIDGPVTCNAATPEDTLANKNKGWCVTGSHVSTEVLKEYKKTAIEILQQRKLENEKRLAKESQKSEKLAESLKSRQTDNVVNAFSATKCKNERRLVKSPKIKRFCDQKERRELNNKRDNNTRNLKNSTSGNITKTYGSTKDLTCKEKSKFYHSPLSVKRHPSVISRKSISPLNARYKAVKGKKALSPNSNASLRRAPQDDTSILRNSSGEKKGEKKEAPEKLTDPNPSPNYLCQNSKEDNNQYQCGSYTQERHISKKASLMLANEETDTNYPHLELIQGILKSPTAKAVQALGRFYRLLENSNDQATEELTPEVDISVADILRKYKDILADNKGTSLINTAADVSITEKSQLDKAEEIISNSSFKIPNRIEMISEGYLNRNFFDSNKTGKHNEMACLADQTDLANFSFDSGKWSPLAEATKTTKYLPLNSKDSSKILDRHPEKIRKESPDNDMRVEGQKDDMNRSETSLCSNSKTPDGHNKTSTLQTILSSKVCRQAHIGNQLNAKDVLGNISSPGQSQHFVAYGKLSQPRKSTKSYQGQQKVSRDTDNESLKDKVKYQLIDYKISLPKIQPSDDRSATLSPSFHHLDKKSYPLNNASLPLPIRSSEANPELNDIMNLPRYTLPKQPVDNDSHPSNNISTCEKACSPFSVAFDREIESKRNIETATDITNTFPGKADINWQMSLPDLSTSIEQDWNHFPLDQSPLLKRKEERQTRRFADIYEINLSRFRPQERTSKVVGKPCNDPSSSKLSGGDVIMSHDIRRSQARITADANLAKKKTCRKAHNKLLQFTSAQKSDDEIIRESSSDEESGSRELDHSVYESLKMDETRKKLCEGIREKLKSKQMEASSISSKYWKNGSKPKKTHSFGSTTQVGINKTKEFANLNIEHSREIQPVSHALPKNKPKSRTGSDLSVLKANTKARLTFKKALNNYLRLRKFSHSTNEFGNDCIKSECRLPAKQSLPQVREGLIKSNSTSQIPTRSFTKDTIIKTQSREGMMIRSKSFLKAPKEDIGSRSQNAVIQTRYADIQENHVLVKSISSQTMPKKRKNKTNLNNDEVESSEEDTSSSVRKKIVRKTCLKILEERRQQFELALAAGTDSKTTTSPVSHFEYTSNMSQVNGSGSVDPKDHFQYKRMIRRDSMDETKSKTDVPSISVNDTHNRFESSSHKKFKRAIDKDAGNNDTTTTEAEKKITLTPSFETKTLSTPKNVSIPKNSTNIGMRQKIQNIVSKNYRQGLRRTIVNEMRRKFEHLKAIKDIAKSKDCSVSPAYKDSQENSDSGECICRTQSGLLLTEENNCLGPNSFSTEMKETQQTDEVLTSASALLTVTSCHAASVELWTRFNAKLYSFESMSCKKETHYIYFHTTVFYIAACFIENARLVRLLFSFPKYKYLGELILPKEAGFHNDIFVMLSSLRFQMYRQKWNFYQAREAEVESIQHIHFKRVLKAREHHPEKDSPLNEFVHVKSSEVNLERQCLYSDDLIQERNCRMCQKSWLFSEDGYDQIAEKDLPKHISGSTNIINERDTLFQNASSQSFRDNLNISGEILSGSHENIQHTNLNFLSDEERPFEPFYSSLPLSNIFISISPERIVLLPFVVRVRNRETDRSCVSDNTEACFEGKMGPTVSEICSEEIQNEVNTQIDGVPALRKALSTDNNQILKENPQSLISLASKEDNSRLSLSAFEIPNRVSSLNEGLLMLQETQPGSTNPNCHDVKNYQLTKTHSNEETSQDNILNPVLQKTSSCLETTLNVLSDGNNISFMERKEGNLSTRKQKFYHAHHAQMHDSNVPCSILQRPNSVSWHERDLEEDLVETRKQSTQTGCDGITINTFLSSGEYEEFTDSALKSLESRKLNEDRISDKDKTCITDASAEKSNGQFVITNKMNYSIKSTTIKRLHNYDNAQERHVSSKTQDYLGLEKGIHYKPFMNMDNIQGTEYTDEENCVISGKKEEGSKSEAMTYEQFNPSTELLEKEQSQQNISKYYPYRDDQRMDRNVSPLSMETESSHKFSDVSPSNISSRLQQENNSICGKCLEDLMTHRAESEELSSLVYHNINILATDITESCSLRNLKEENLDHCDDSDNIDSISSDCIDSVVAANERYLNDKSREYLSNMKKVDVHEIKHYSPTCPQDTVDDIARVGTSTIGRNCISPKMLVRICPKSPKTIKNKGNKLKRRKPDSAEIYLLTKRSRINKDMDDSCKSGVNQSTLNIPCHNYISNKDVLIGSRYLETKSKFIRFSSTETQHNGTQYQELNHGLEKVDLRKSSLSNAQGKEKSRPKACNFYLDNDINMIKPKNDAMYRSSKNRRILGGHCQSRDDKVHDSKKGSASSTIEKKNLKSFREFAAVEHFIPMCDQNSKKKVKFISYHPNVVKISGQSKFHFYDEQNLPVYNGFRDSTFDDQELRSKSCSDLDKCASFDNINLEPDPVMKGPFKSQDYNGKVLTQHLHTFIDTHQNNDKKDSNNHIILSQEDIQSELPLDFFQRPCTCHQDAYSIKNVNNRLNSSKAIDELYGKRRRKNFCSSCEDDARIVTLGNSIGKDACSETGSDTYGDIGSLVTEIVDSSSSTMRPDLRVKWSSGPREKFPSFCNESGSSQDKDLHTMMASCLVAALENVLSGRYFRNRGAKKMKRLRRKKDVAYSNNYYFQSFNQRSQPMKSKKTIIPQQLSSPITRSRCRTYDTNTLAQVSSLPEDDSISWHVADLDNDTGVKNEYSPDELEPVALPQINAQTSQCQPRNMAPYGFEADFLNHRFRFDDYDNRINNQERTSPQQCRYCSHDTKYCDYDHRINHQERTSPQQCGYCSHDTKYCVADTTPEEDKEIKVFMTEKYQRDKPQIPHIDITKVFLCSSIPFQSKSLDYVSYNSDNSLTDDAASHTSYPDYRLCTSDPIFCKSKGLNEEIKIKYFKSQEKSDCKNKNPWLSNKMKSAFLSHNKSCQTGDNSLLSGNTKFLYIKENERDPLFKISDEIQHINFKQDEKELYLYNSSTSKIIRSKSDSDISHNIILKDSFHTTMQQCRQKPSSSLSDCAFYFYWPESRMSRVYTTVSQKSQKETSSEDKNKCLDVNIKTTKGNTLDRTQSYSNIKEKTGVFVKNSTKVQNLDLASKRSCNLDCSSVQVSNPNRKLQCHAIPQSTESTAAEKGQETSSIHNINRSLSEENLKQLVKKERLEPMFLQTSEIKQAPTQQSLVKQIITKPFTQNFYAEQLSSQGHSGQSLAQENLKKLLPLKSSKISRSQENSIIDLSKEDLAQLSVKGNGDSILEDRNNMLLALLSHEDNQLSSIQGNDKQILRQKPIDMPLKQGNTELQLTKINIQPLTHESIKQPQTHDDIDKLSSQKITERQLMLKGDDSLRTEENIEQLSTQRSIKHQVIEKGIEHSLIKESNEQSMKQYNVLFSPESHGTRTSETNNNIEQSLSQKLMNMSMTLAAFFQEPFKIENIQTTKTGEINNIDQSLTIKKSDSFQLQDSLTWPFLEENRNQVLSTENFDETPLFEAKLRQSLTLNCSDRSSVQGSTEQILSQECKKLHPALEKPELALHKNQNTYMPMQKIIDKTMNEDNLEQIVTPERILLGNERKMFESSTLIPNLTRTSEMNEKNVKQDFQLRNFKLQLTSENTKQSSVHDYIKLPSPHMSEIKSIYDNLKHCPNVSKQSSNYGHNGHKTQCDDTEHSMSGMDEKRSIFQHKCVNIIEAKEKSPYELPSDQGDSEKTLNCKPSAWTKQLISQPLKIVHNNHSQTLGNCLQQDDHKMSFAQEDMKQLSANDSSGLSRTLQRLLHSSPQAGIIQVWSKIGSKHECRESEDHKKRQQMQDNISTGHGVDESDKTPFIGENINVSERNISRRASLITRSVEEKLSQENMAEPLTKESTMGAQKEEIIETIDKPLIRQENSMQPKTIEENNEPLTQNNNDRKISESRTTLTLPEDREKQLSIRERIEQLLKQDHSSMAEALPQSRIMQSLASKTNKQLMCQGTTNTPSQRKDIKIPFLQGSTHEIREELSSINPDYSSIDYVNQPPHYLIPKTDATFQKLCIDNTKPQLLGRTKLKSCEVKDEKNSIMATVPLTERLPCENNVNTRLKGFCMLRKRMGFQYRFHPFNIFRREQRIKKINDKALSNDVFSEYSSLLQSLSTSRKNTRLVYPSQTSSIWYKSSAGGNSPTNWLSNKNSINYISIHKETDNNNRKIEDPKRDMSEERVQSEFVQVYGGLDNQILSSNHSLRVLDNLRSINKAKRICNSFEVDNVKENCIHNTHSMIPSETNGQMAVAVRNRNSKDNTSNPYELKLVNSMENTTDNYFQQCTRDKTHNLNRQQKGRKRLSHIQEFTSNQRPEQSLISNAYHNKAQCIPRDVRKQNVSLSSVTNSDHFCNNILHNSASSKRNIASALSPETQMSSFQAQDDCQVRQQHNKKSKNHRKSHCPGSCKADGEQNLVCPQDNDNQNLTTSHSQFDHIIENHKKNSNQGLNYTQDKQNDRKIPHKNAQQCITIQTERNFGETQQASNKSLINSQSERDIQTPSTVELVNASPYEIVREFLSKKTRPVQIPVDIYPFPSKWTPNHKKTTTDCGPRTMAISGPLMNLNIPVYHHESNLQQKYCTDESNFGNESDIPSKTLENSHEEEKCHQAKISFDEDMVNESQGFEAKQGEFHTSDRSGPADIDYSSQSNQLIYHFTDKSPGVPKPRDFTLDDSRNKMRSFNQLRQKMKRMLRFRKK